MQQTATPEQKKTVRHYERNLIKLLSMSEADHTKALVEDGYDKQLIKARLQTIRGHMVNELRNIQRWRKGKSLN